MAITEKGRNYEIEQKYELSKEMFYSLVDQWRKNPEILFDSKFMKAFSSLSREFRFDLLLIQGATHTEEMDSVLLTKILKRAEEEGSLDELMIEKSTSISTPNLPKERIESRGVNKPGLRVKGQKGA